MNPRNPGPWTSRTTLYSHLRFLTLTFSRSENGIRFDSFLEERAFDGPACGRVRQMYGKPTFRPSETVSVNTSTFGRSRPAADASREVAECWLLDGLR